MNGQKKEDTYIIKSKNKIATGNTKKVLEKRKKESKTVSKKKVEIENQVDENKNLNNVNNEKNKDKKENKKENINDIKIDKDKKLKKIEELKIAEDVKEEIKENNKIPIEKMNKINTEIFFNIVIAVGIMVYLILIILGFTNIDNNVFIKDLKVFGFSILIIDILVFESAYKNDNNKEAILGIEILILALATVSFIYVDLMIKNKFVIIVTICSFLFAIYYTLKSIIIYCKMKKAYFINKMKEIIRK